MAQNEISKMWQIKGCDIGSQADFVDMWCEVISIVKQYNWLFPVLMIQHWHLPQARRSHQIQSSCKLKQREKTKEQKLNQTNVDVAMNLTENFSTANLDIWL